MLAPLLALYEDLDKSKLRFKYPSKFIFLCGGIIADVAGVRPISLRDYLYRVRNIQARLNGDIVLAERATQIYRDTDYTDLISFEEDIARIAAIVLVIPESPGSLAELGAFATNDTIRRALRVITPERYANSESFVRYGPIQRVIKTHGRDFIGVYPWRDNKSHQPVVRSIAPHYRSIVDFINDHLRRVHASVAFSLDTELTLFFVMYWIIYLFFAVSTPALEDCVASLLPGATTSEIHKKLYCMMLAGWVHLLPYAGKDYYYVTLDEDPFAYSYIANARERDTLRRKTDISLAVRALESIPSAVIRAATVGRKAPLS